MHDSYLPAIIRTASPNLHIEPRRRSIRDMEPGALSLSPAPSRISPTPGHHDRGHHTRPRSSVDRAGAFSAWPQVRVLPGAPLPVWREGPDDVRPALRGARRLPAGGDRDRRLVPGRGRRGCRDLRHSFRRRGRPRRGARRRGHRGHAAGAGVLPRVTDRPAAPAETDRRLGHAQQRDRLRRRRRPRRHRVRYGLLLDPARRTDLGPAAGPGPRHRPGGQRALREGGPWQQTVGADLHGRRLGLLGLGRIGGRVARGSASPSACG